MDKLEKIIELHRLFSRNKRALSLEYILERLDCVESTFHRLRTYMVKTLNAPIFHDANRGGYRYDLNDGDRFELPGLWLSVKETEALLGFQNAMEAMQQGFFSEVFTPVKKHLNGFLKKQGLYGTKDANPVRIIPLHSRQVDDALFRTCADAVVAKRTLFLEHDKPDGSSTVDRTVSPFSLIRYRDNWYLDAWCHLRGELRTFSLDRIRSVSASSVPFHPVTRKDRDLFYADAYGIFNGPAVHTARIRFTGVAAAQVSREQWHPRQTGERSPDGSYLLTLPYGDDRELVMDILKWGPNADVVSPPELRNRVKSLLSGALRHY